MKYLINSHIRDEWYEAHKATPYPNGADGKPTGCTFIVFSESVYEEPAGHMFKNKKGTGAVVLIGKDNDFKPGDEVVVSWPAERPDPRSLHHYQGKILDIDEDAQVARIKLVDDNDGWVPFAWTHKLVQATWEDLGWKDPAAVAAEKINADGGNTSGAKSKKSSGS